MNNNEVMLRPEQEAFLITERIKDYGKIAVNAVCKIGKDLRRMKIENLYVHLGYESFEDYAEKEFQLKRRQAYQYISVFEKLGEEFVQSNAQLGITKLALLATTNPEDRAEIMESEDVPNMTAKELEELLAKYKEQGEQLSFLQDQNAGLVKENEELQGKLDDSPIVEKEVIKEVADPQTLKELAKIKKDFKESEKELKNAKKEAEIFKKSAEDVKKQAEAEKTALQAKIAELQKAAEKPAESADKSSFKAMLASAYKEIAGLIEFIKSSEVEDRCMYIQKVYQILGAGDKALKSIDIGLIEDDEVSE